MEYHPAFYSSDADEALIGNKVRPDIIGQNEIDNDPTEGLLLEINRPNDQEAVFVPASDKRNGNNTYNSITKGQIKNEINEINTSINMDNSLNHNGEVEGFNSNQNNLDRGIFVNLAIIIVLLFIFFILMSD